VNFGMTPKNNKKDMREIMVLKDGMRWWFGGNSNRHSSREQFSWCSQFGADNRNWKIHGSVTTHTGSSVSFSAHAKQMVRLI